MSSDGHPDGAILDAYLRRELAAEDASRITAHLAECASCRDRLASSQQFAASASEIKRYIDDAAETEHLSFDDELVPYVDGRLGDVEAEIVDSHLATCAECTADVEDLRALRRSLGAARLSGRRTIWIAAAAAVVIVLGTAWWRIARAPQRQPATQIAQQNAAQPLAVVHDDKRTIVLERDGRVRGVPEEWQALVAETLRRRTLSVANVAEFRRGNETLLGATDRTTAIHLLEPVNVVVADDRPTFRWNGPAGAQYVVEVYDDEFTRVAASDRVRAESWTANRTLPRGASYSWQVVAKTEGREITVPAPPSPAARFKIVSTFDAAEIARARTIGPPSHLLLAIVYAKAGLRREAEQELRILADQNPQSTLPADLLHSLQR